MPHRDSPVPEPVASRIAAVTVYQDGALVTRESLIVKSDGGFPGTVRLANLPLSLDDSSIRARVESSGSDDSVPEATDLRVLLDVPESDDDLPPDVDEEILEARAEEARLKERLEQLERSASRLRQLKVPPRPGGKKETAPASSPAAARVAVLAFHRKELEALHGEEQAVERDYRVARERRLDLETRRRSASTARQARVHELRKAVVVRLDAKDSSANEARLVLEYLVSGARWAPAYTFKFDQAMTRTEILLRALVCQSTGEDWDAVRLTLSTAQAKRWTELPELTSLRIGRRQSPRPTRGWRPLPKGSDLLYGDYDRVFSKAKSKAQPSVGADSPAVPAASPEASEPGSLIGVNDAVNFLGISEEEVGHLRSVGALHPVWLAGEMLFSFDQVSALAEGERAPLQAALESPREEIIADQAIALEDTVCGGMEEVCFEEPDAGDFGDLSLDEPPPLPLSAAGPAYGGIAPAAAGPPPGAVPKGRQVSRAQLKNVMRRSRSSSSRERVAKPSVPTVEPLLEYGALHMPPAEKPGRGELSSLPEIETYMELLVSLDVSISVKLLTAILRVTKEITANVAGKKLPDHYRPPEAVGGYDYAYSTDTDVSLPSDGQFHSIGLSHREAESSLSFVTVPRESQDVFRFVELTNPLKAPLLEGPADIHIGGDFLMTTPLRQVAPRGRIQLGLGVEQGVKVARNTSYTEETSGLMSGSLRLEHEIRIEAIHHLQRTIPLEVRERIPVTVAGDDHVEVKLKEVKPAWEIWKQDEQPVKGGYRWKVSLSPGKAHTLRATYVIQLPSKGEIAGGNRREG